MLSSRIRLLIIECLQKQGSSSQEPHVPVFPVCAIEACRYHNSIPSKLLLLCDKRSDKLPDPLPRKRREAALQKEMASPIEL